MIVINKKDIAKYMGMDSRLDAGLRLIADGDVDKAAVGRCDISDKMYFNVQSYKTKDINETSFESHSKWIDIQYIRKGIERMDVLLSKEGLREAERIESSDVIFYTTDKTISNTLYLEEGMIVVFYPEDIHRPSICADVPSDVEKVVIKTSV